MTSPHFSSRLGTILTMIGVAVGLGNVWRFPYMMGSYGGSAFLLMYLLFTLMFAFPALMTEIAVGKKSGKGTVHALQLVLGEKFGGIAGYLLLAVVTIADSYYAVIISNVFFSALFSAFKGYSEATNPAYGDLLSNGLLQYGLTLVLISISLFVIHLGLNKGVERISKFIIPFFGLSIVYLIVYSITLPGATDKLIEFLKPDIGAIGSSEVFAALGQAFFSLGLGGTFVVVYSGYMNKDENIPKTALFTSLGDLGSSVLVSLFLVSCILLFGLEMNSGPSLIFNTFPALFSTMPAGRFVGTLFLTSLSFVAFLSLIAAYQVPVRSVESIKPSLSRKTLLK